MQSHDLLIEHPKPGYDWSLEREENSTIARIHSPKKETISQIKFCFTFSLGTYLSEYVPKRGTTAI